MFIKSVSLLQWSQEDEAKVQVLGQMAREKIQAELRTLSDRQAQRDGDEELQASLVEMRRQGAAAVQYAARVASGEAARPQWRPQLPRLDASQPAQLAILAPEAEEARPQWRAAQLPPLEERSRVPKRPVSPGSDGDDELRMAELEAEMLEAEAEAVELQAKAAALQAGKLKAKMAVMRARAAKKARRNE